MAEQQETEMATPTTPGRNPDTSPQTTLNDHRRTYDRMIGMFKWLIIAVAFILLGLLVFLR